MNETTNTETYKDYSDLELMNAADGFADAYCLGANLRTRLGDSFGNPEYHLDALHGAALEMNVREDSEQAA